MTRPTARRPLVKVCGIATVAGARAAVEAGADRLGVVLARSPRGLDLDRAVELVRAVPAAWVGVFVNAAADRLAEAAERLELSAVQLHGGESPADCRRAAAATGGEVWKAVAWRDDRTAIDRYAGAADVVLLDAAIGRGGTGRALPWEAIAAALGGERPLPIVLAGGLGPDNVAEAIGALDPDGVDASSRLERTPGDKDPAAVTAFVEAARRAAGARSRP